jgi:hypothetical protein
MSSDDGAPAPSVSSSSSESCDHYNNELVAAAREAYSRSWDRQVAECIEQDIGTQPDMLFEWREIEEEAATAAAATLDEFESPPPPSVQDTAFYDNLRETASFLAEQYIALCKDETKVPMNAFLSLVGDEMRIAMTAAAAERARKSKNKTMSKTTSKTTSKKRKENEAHKETKGKRSRTSSEDDHPIHGEEAAPPSAPSAPSASGSIGGDKDMDD